MLNPTLKLASKLYDHGYGPRNHALAMAESRLLRVSDVMRSATRNHIRTRRFRSLTTHAFQRKSRFRLVFLPDSCKLRVRLVFVSDWFVPVQKLAENRTACLERWSVRPPRSPPVAKGAPCCSRLLLFASVVSVERPVSLKGNGNEHKETHSNLFLKGRGVEGGWKRTEKHEEAQFTTGRCF